MSTVETGARPNIVQRAMNMIMRPKTEWEVVDREPATIQGLFLGYVCILAAIPAVCQLIGALVFGYSAFGFSWRPSPVTAISSAVVTYVMTLISVAVLALVVEFLAPTFGGQKDRIQAFKVAAYAGTASWLAGIFNIIPAISFLAIVGLYSLYLLYLGLPRLMKTPQEKALPYTAVVIVAAVVVTLIAGMVAAPIMALSRPAAPAAGSVTLPGGTTITAPR